MKALSDGKVQVIGRAVRALLVGALLAIGLAHSAKADTIYTYTGNAFTVFGGSYACPPECSITGSFSMTTPLPPNAPYLTGITPSAYDFTDGNKEFTNLNSLAYYFYISTDASGEIDYWSIDLGTPTSPTVYAELLTGRLLFSAQDIGIDATPNISYGENAGAPGTWTTSPVPEPSTLLLLGTGLLGLGTRVLRRKQIV